MSRVFASGAWEGEEEEGEARFATGGGKQRAEASAMDAGAPRETREDEFRLLDVGPHQRIADERP